MSKDPPPREKPAETVDELTQRNVHTIIQLDEATRLQRGWGDRIADTVTGFCGSMAFVWLHVIGFGVWIVLNTLVLPREKQFDPFPFQFLTLVVSLEAIFLSTFILISQNRASKLDQRRSHLDLQIDLLAEQENTKMLEILHKIACKLNIDMQHDQDVGILIQATEPQRLVDQIEATIAASEKGEASPFKGKAEPSAGGRQEDRASRGK